MDHREETLLKQWNNTQQDYPKNQNLVALIEQSCMKFPEKTAMYYQDKSITYHQLNILSNQLAYFICQSASGSGNRIAIYLERSIEQIYGIISSPRN